MPQLEIFVKSGCFGCEEARRLWQFVAQLPNLDARIVEVEAGRILPDPVVAVPIYLLDGKVLSLGNPQPRALFGRLATEVFSSRGPLLVASGALVRSLLLGLILLISAGICFTAGALRLNFPISLLRRDLGAIGALMSALVLGTYTLWAPRLPLTVSEEGLRLGRTSIRWVDITRLSELDGPNAGLEVRSIDGRCLRIARRRLDARTYRELRQWLLVLTRSDA